MDLRTLLKTSNVRIWEVGEHHHARDGWIQVDCPYCSYIGAEKARLGLTSRSANCWVCGRKNLLKSLMDLTKQSASICRQAIDDTDFHYDDKRQHLRGKLVMPDNVGFLQKPHLRYLDKHKLDPEYLQKTWDIRGIGISDRLQWRLWIPVYLDGEIVTWTTRSIDDDNDQKYVNARPDQEIYSPKALLYGEDKCNHVILVVEGPKDVWRIGPGAVATFGSNFTDAQVYRIAQYPVRYICYDNEPDAQRQARKLCRELACFDGETRRVRIEAKDPGSAGKKERRKLRSLFN